MKNEIYIYCVVLGIRLQGNAPKNGKTTVGVSSTMLLHTVFGQECLSEEQRDSTGAFLILSWSGSGSFYLFP
jgi:predicted membrane chloride channel (bestrophin family)